MHSASPSMSSPRGPQSTRLGSALLMVGKWRRAACVLNVGMQQVQILSLPSWIVNILCDGCSTFIHVNVAKILRQGKKHVQNQKNDFFLMNAKGTSKYFQNLTSTTGKGFVTFWIDYMRATARPLCCQANLFSQIFSVRRWETGT